jgi:hypothetical protein
VSPAVPVPEAFRCDPPSRSHSAFVSSARPRSAGQRFVETFDSLDDVGALGLINAHFDRDMRMVALRQKELGDFQQVLGTKLVVRVMQIDRRLSLSHQLQFTAKIPLAQ